MLTLRHIEKTFNPGTINEVRSLDRVSLDIPPSSFVMVLGTNGSGKSTLLNAVAGTFPIDAGSIHLASRDITSWPEHRRAQLIGRVFQNPLGGTAPDLSIAENLALASRRGLPRPLSWALRRPVLESFRDRVRQLNMGLENRLDNAMGSLSGGQRQALTLLMATWRQPHLLLLDEHTAALDPKSADQVIRLTEDIVASQKLTTLMVTHSMHQAVSLGDRLIMMHRGRIVFDAQGPEKKRLRVPDLLARFDDIRRREQLTPSLAAWLRDHYL
ncbi:MAG: ATP-binding cassette domain-containing protein [Verrucomicrobiia bacterium]